MGDADTSVAVWQGEFELLPPDPWGAQRPDPPAGAMRPEMVAVPSPETAGRRGRQAGSANKRADDQTTYIARRYGSPLEHAARLFAKPVAELAREMGVRGIVAAQHKLAVGKLLARYVEAAPAKPVLLAANVTHGIIEGHFRAAQANGMRGLEELKIIPKREPPTTTLAQSKVVLLPGLPPRGRD